MMNKNVKVCEVTSVALDDGISLLPGYIEVTSKGAFAHYSDDPENQTRYFEGKLVNRCQYVRREKLDISPCLFMKTNKSPKHFKDLWALNEWLKRQP